MRSLTEGRDKRVPHAGDAGAGHLHPMGRTTSGVGAERPQHVVVWLPTNVRTTDLAPISHVNQVATLADGIVGAIISEHRVIRHNNPDLTTIHLQHHPLLLDLHYVSI